MSNNILVDIEITNKCNAVCYFCPRHATPHEGIMDIATFDKSLERAIEYRDARKDIGGAPTAISLCGLGEPLLNRNAVSFVKKVKDAGFECKMASNGAALNEKKAHQLIEAGLDEIMFNISDIDEAYEKVYNLPFARTHDNVVRFAKLAEGKCKSVVVLVDHHKDKKHIDAMKAYWRERGINDFIYFDVINRGGALFVDSMQFEEFEELSMAANQLRAGGNRVMCGAPFIYLFIGYDGNYYLCCSDWRKNGNLGSVFDLSFFDVVKGKVEMVTSRNPVCKTCNHDPINQLTQELRALKDGETTPEKVQVFTESLLQSSEKLNNRVKILIDYADRRGQKVSAEKIVS